MSEDAAPSGALSARILTRPLAQRVAGLLASSPAAPATAIPTPPAVLEQALDALAAGKTHYTDRPGILPLREVIARQLEQLGISISPEVITITCGVTEARFVAVKQFTQPNDTLLDLSEGSGGTITGAAHLAGAVLITNPKAENPRMIYVNSPSGYRRALDVQGMPWIVWEINAETPSTGILIPMARTSGALERTVFIGDSGLPAWRVGWMAGSKAAGKLRAFKQSMTICTASVSQWAMLGLAGKEGGR